MNLRIGLIALLCLVSTGRAGPSGPGAEFGGSFTRELPCVIDLGAVRLGTVVLPISVSHRLRREYSGELVSDWQLGAISPSISPARGGAIKWRDERGDVLLLAKGGSKSGSAPYFVPHSSGEITVHSRNGLKFVFKDWLLQRVEEPAGRVFWATVLDGRLRAIESRADGNVRTVLSLDYDRIGRIESLTVGRTAPFLFAYNSLGVLSGLKGGPVALDTAIGYQGPVVASVSNGGITNSFGWRRVSELERRRYFLTTPLYVSSDNRFTYERKRGDGGPRIDVYLAGRLVESRTELLAERRIVTSRPPKR